MASQLLQGLFPRPRRVHLELLLGEEFFEGVADRLLVVHDQDLDGPTPRVLGHDTSSPSLLRT